jgi:uncharacterized protein (DUF2236 family)
MSTVPSSLPAPVAAERANAVHPGLGTMAWRIHRERIMLLSWGRAILLQFAHPLVAAGVAEHSRFGAGPRENRRRLHRTVQAMLDLTFGSPARAGAAAGRIDAIHGRVTGRLATATGAHPAGAAYAARMPELLCWVHATMLDSSLLVYGRYVGPLTAAEQDQYCAESRALGPLLGLPAAMIPATRADLDAYMARMLSSGEVAVGDTARGLMCDLLQARPASFVRGPLLTLLHLPTVGLLPPAIRAAYGLDWSPAHATALAAGAAASRRLLPLLPPQLRYWSVYLDAMHDA